MNKWLKFSLSVILIMIGIILYARFVGTMGFKTKEYYVVDENLPYSYDGIKIIHFSDIHYGRSISTSKIDDIIKEINLINPDIVVFTGDLIDNDTDINNSDLSYLTDAFKRINAKYGKYAVMGNHDYKFYDEIINIYENSNFKYLENSYDIIYNKDNDKIFIGGLGNASYNLDNIDKMMEYFNNNNDISYKVILVHEPDISDEIIDNYMVNLILGGHSHNGQVRLPFIGALYTPNGSKKYYDEYYLIENTNLYISSGIGVSLLNYRLWNRPSINFYRVNID